MQTVKTGAALTARFVPGQPDMWALVIFEACLFTSYFAVYMVCRVLDPQLFLQSQANLDPRWGVFNTLVVLISSWSMSRYVQAAREGIYNMAVKNAILTLIFGVLFVGSKALEWSTEIRKGFTYTTNEVIG